jgi:GH43 family beta-xylosidase
LRVKIPQVLPGNSNQKKSRNIIHLIANPGTSGGGRLEQNSREKQVGKESSKSKKRSGLAPRTLSVERLEPRAMLAGEGLTGQYFHNENFTGLAAERTEAVAFNWGSSSPVAGVDADTFSVRWTGQVESIYSEQYTFYTTSNQGVRLWVDGRLLVDNWVPHNSEVDTATIILVAGQKYDLRLDYFEQFGTAEMKLEWSSPSQPRQVVPQSQLYASPEGLRGEYSDAFGGSAVRIDPVIDFNWGTGRPHPSVAVDQTKVQWSGQIRADHSEEYTFAMENDEGVRLWIGNDLVIDDWTPHTTQITTGAKMLEAGKWYDIRIEYFDKTGQAEVDLQWSSTTQTGEGVFAVVPTSNLRAAKVTPLQFTNPLGPGADPFVTYHEGSYYMVNTTGNNVRMERAERLEDIQISDPNSASTVVWTPPNGTNYSEQIWAPELHRLNGKWYIYVAASDGNNSTHRMHVLERDDPNPMGPFVYKGQLNTTRWAIDGTVLSWQGQLYFVWSGWPGATDGQQNLYIATMSDPMTISGPRVLISNPTFAWEQHGLAINEGPQILIHDGKLHIIYSGSAYWRHEYALGRLTYDGVGSILSASSWQKSPTPVFQQAGNVVGTGHASFTTSPDGTENWIVYHAHHDKNNFQDDRDIYIQQFDFNSNGTPNLGSPIPADVPLSVPSGPADPERPFLEGDFDANGSVDSADLLVWQAQYGTTLFPGISADSNGNGLIDGRDFLVWQRNFAAVAVVDPTAAYWRHEEGLAGSSVASGSNAVQDASGHGNNMRTLNPSFSSATYSSSVSPLPLSSGFANNLSLDFGPGGDDAGQNDHNYSEIKPLNSLDFTAMTVELAFQMNSIGGFQTLVGKDGKPSSSPVAPLQIKVRGDSFPDGINNQLFVEWIDGDGDIHFLASGSSINTEQWNHVAFVLTETSAELYMAGETGGYALVDSIQGNDFAGALGEVLINSTGNFTVGRGMYNNNATDWSDAKIDEVRISDRALTVTEFLFNPSGGFQALSDNSAIERSNEITDSRVFAVPSLSLLAREPARNSVMASRETDYLVFEDLMFSDQSDREGRPQVVLSGGTIELDERIPRMVNHRESYLKGVDRAFESNDFYSAFLSEMV